MASNNYDAAKFNTYNRLGSDQVWLQHLAVKHPLQTQTNGGNACMDTLSVKQLI